MTTFGSIPRLLPVWAVLLLAAAGTGCVHRRVPSLDMPRELDKVNHPAYTIEPPDILQIDALQTIPLPPYRVRPLDSLGIQVEGAFPKEPISGLYPVDPEGTVTLGTSYGSVRVAGLTIPEARDAIQKQLERVLKEPNVDVVLAEGRGVQQIRGQHLVRPDGTVSLGEYGAVNVTGLTIPQAKAKIETHLRQYLQDPEVTVDVLAYNSKVYYVILDGGGAGQQVVRLPATGNETVLDAVSQVSGLSAVSDQHRIWVSRPGPDGCETTLPVDWPGLTAKGQTRTNYQLLPGDRVFVKAYPLVSLDSALARIISPAERVFGFILLGSSTVQTLQQFGSRTGGGFGNTTGTGVGTGVGVIVP